MTERRCYSRKSRRDRRGRVRENARDFCLRTFEIVQALLLWYREISRHTEKARTRKISAAFFFFFPESSKTTKVIFLCVAEFLRVLEKSIRKSEHCSILVLFRQREILFFCGIFAKFVQRNAYNHEMFVFGMFLILICCVHFFFWAN